jgi:hypothetical protein
MEQGMNPGLLRTFEVVLEGKWAGRVMVFVLIPVLLVASVLLPPVSLVERALSAGHTTFTQIGGSVLDPDGTQLTVPPGAASERVQIQFTSIPQADFLAGTAGDQAIAQAIPNNLEMKSPLYVFSVRGQMPEEAILSIPIPNDAEPLTTLDLYAWTGREWLWLPKTILYEDDHLETSLSSIPPAVAVMQTIPVVPSVSAPLPVDSVLPSEAREVLVEVEAVGLSLQSDGIDGRSTMAAAAGLSEQPGEGTSYIVLPNLGNEIDGVIRSDLVNNILITEELRRNHIEEIVNLVVQNMYPGINIHYLGMDPGLRDHFTTFITELSQELHAHHKLLTVAVEPPVQIAEDRWETGAYDWQAIGQVVDGFKLPGLSRLDAYAPGGQMEALLGYAVNNVDRYKIQVSMPSYSTDWVGDSVTPRSYAEALQLVGGDLILPEGRNTFAPGELITVQLSGGTGGVNYHEQCQSYWFTYTDQQGEHTVWLENATSMAHKLDLISKYNLKGVSIPGLLHDGNDEQTWEVLQEYLNSVTPAADAQFAVVWTVESAVGAHLTQEVGSLTEPVFAWTAPEEGGEFSISAAISDDGGQTADFEGGRVSFLVSEPTPTPPPPTPTPVVAATPRPSGGSTGPAPTPTPPPPSAPAPAGTGFNYGIQMTSVNSENLGHMANLGFKWIKLQIRWGDYHQPSPGPIEWGNLDSQVAQANAGGYKLLFSVLVAPAWARGGRAEEVGPPVDYADYGNFVGAMAQKYCGQVHAIEVWNEENLRREWNTGRKLSAREYVDLLKVAYNRIKAACPGMIVVSGAPTPTGWNDGIVAIDDAQYLREMYQAGLSSYCDAVGVHPSGFGNPPDATSESCRASGGSNCHRSNFFLSTIETYHNVMVNNGDGNKKLWATEFGWASLEGIDGAHNPDYPYQLTNSEQNQADWIVRAYQTGKQKGYMGVMFLWNLDWAVAVGGDMEMSKFSILRPSRSHRPAYDALAAMPK